MFQQQQDEEEQQQNKLYIQGLPTAAIHGGVSTLIVFTETT